MTNKPEESKSTESGGTSKKKKKLSEKDLNKVSGGAFPTPVNGQITDIVTPGGDDSDG